MLHIEDMRIRRGSDYQIVLPRLILGRGEVAAITGASGCGKSTLLEMIGLILRPDGLGQFRLGDADGLDVAALLRDDRQAQLADIRAQRLGFVLQSGGLLPFLSVRQNIELPRRMLGLPGKSELVDEAISRLCLQPLLGKLPAQLSIGERQRVAVARALAHDPAVVLADEPTAALDPALAEEVMTLLSELALEQGTTLLVVTHDAELAAGAGITIVRCEVRPGRTSIVAEVA